MPQRRKYTPEEKIKIIKEYLSGQSSLKDIGSRYGYTNCDGYPNCYRRWINQYREHGESVFFHKGNSCYTKGFKTKVVEEYLAGTASSMDIATKYKISNETVLLRWVELYNANRELKDYITK